MMRNFQLLSCFIVLAWLTGCSGEPKKVLIMASGKIQVNENTITLEPGTTHNEEELMVNGDKITVKAPSGDMDIEVKEGGLYLLNLKKDTLVGSYQRVGTSTEQIKISREDLKHRLDSMVMLMQGQNVTKGNRNYWIAPMKMEKITGNTQAQIVGPFQNLPRSYDPDKEHEIYKFHTNKEVVEIIEKIRPMTESGAAESE